MKKFSKNAAGFSLIEMLIASVLVLVLSAASYKILTGQGQGQRQAAFGMKKNSRILSALDRFKKDASQVDYNWSKYGVSAVYPHQGLEFGDNFYVTSAIQSEGLNDGVTLLRRNADKADLYTLNVNADFPTAGAGNVLLYGVPLALTETTTQLVANDWVLIFQAGKYALGVVTAAVNGTPATITLRVPNASETQAINSGYVNKAGVIPGSYDWTGTTAATTDDSISFKKTSTRIQPVWPVSYELDWATNDGQPHGTNSFVLDEDGNRKKVMVRTDYTNAGMKREYLAETESMGITYDALDGTEADADVIRNIGRDATSPIQFVNSVSSAGGNFIAMSSILSLRMFLGSDQKVGASDQTQKYNQISVSLDPSRNNETYSEESKSLALNSPNMGLTGKIIGQPLYIYNPSDGELNQFQGNGCSDCRGTNAPTTPDVNGRVEVDLVLPVSPSTTRPTNSGSLLVMDDAGAPATHTATCANGQPSCHEITFNMGTNGFFSPSGLTQIYTQNDVNLYVGGYTVTTLDSGATFSRVPSLMKITYPKGTNFRDFVAANNGVAPTDVGACSLGTANCQMIQIGRGGLSGINGGSPAGTSGDTNNLQDTAAGISAIYNHETGHTDLYVASVTRAAALSNRLSIYKSDETLGTFTEQVIDNTGAYSHSVISAIGQAPVTIGSTKYLPIAVTRQIAEGDTPSGDGKILLYDISSVTPGAPIEIATHNYMAKSLVVVDGNLVVSGKLVSQVIKGEDLAAIVASNQSPKVLATDEIADPGTGTYADAFYTDSSSYVNQGPGMYQDVLGQNMGANILQYSDTEFGVVFGNRAFIDNGGSPYELHDFTTMRTSLGGMGDRVLASIDTNFDNLNSSQVVAKYDTQEKSVPAVLLPGQLYSNSLSPRTTLAPLPVLTSSHGGMNEAAWAAFYLDFVDNPNSAVPDPATVILPGTCVNGTPATCPTS